MMIKEIFIVLLAMTTGTENLNKPGASRIMDEGEHKVIMQVSKIDAGEQRVIVSQVRNVLKSLPNARIEVVFHSQGIPLVLAKQTEVAPHVEELIRNGVVFAACENTMEKMKVSKSDLLEGVITVPSAMAELILKQAEGWIYVKSGI